MIIRTHTFGKRPGKKAQGKVLGPSMKSSFSFTVKDIKDGNTDNPNTEKNDNKTS